jgi:hypothetical protein
LKRVTYFGILYINNNGIGLCVEILGWVLYLGFMMWSLLRCFYGGIIGGVF